MVREGLPTRAQQPNRSRPARLFVAAGVCAVVVLCLVGLGRQSTSGLVTDGTSRHLSQTSAPHTPVTGQTSVARAFSSLSTLGSVLGAGSQQAGPSRQSSTSESLGPTLVLYAYTTEDPVHTANFAYFIRWGMGEARGLDYLVAVRKQVGPMLPVRQPNPKADAARLTSASCPAGHGVLASPAAICAVLAGASQGLQVRLGAAVGGSQGREGQQGKVPVLCVIELRYARAFCTSISAGTQAVGGIVLQQRLRMAAALHIVWTSS